MAMPPKPVPPPMSPRQDQLEQIPLDEESVPNVVGFEQFTSPRGVTDYGQRAYRNAVGYPFPHHQRIPDPVARPIERPDDTPVMSFEEWEAANPERETARQKAENRDITREETALRRIASIDRSIQSLQERRRNGRITEDEYEKSFKKLNDMRERANFDAIPGDRMDEIQDRFLQRREEKLRRREEVNTQLARRSIARRIQRGGDPSRLVTNFNVGGAGKGRYIDPAELGYRRPQAAAAPDGAVVEDDDGKRRIQTDASGERKQVPVIETATGEHIIDPSGLSQQEFDQFYTMGDRQRTAELIYASNSSLASRQRSFDAARNAAALDDYLSPEDRQAALDQINADEAALHRQFLLSNAALLTNRDVTAAKEGRDKKSAERGEVSITEKELLDYINDQREAEGEEPFRTLRDARNGLAGTDKYNQYYQDAIDAKAGETKIAEPAPVPAGRGTQDRQAMTIFDQFIVGFHQMFREDDKEPMAETFAPFFDSEGKLKRGYFSRLAYELDEFLRSKGGYSDVDIQNLIARLIDYMEDMNRRGFQ